jgi:hypothetical protein
MVLNLPMVLLAVAIYFYGSRYDREATLYIFVPVILSVALYVFSGPIDHWWRTKYPLTLDRNIKNWLTKYFPAYRNYDDNLIKKFEERLTLYIDARMFQSVGSEMGEVPYDFKCMVACHGIHMSLGFEDYLIGDMDRIYLYKHPFPTPKHMSLHSVEVDDVDGVIILNTEQLVNALVFPARYYNTAYHAYAESMIRVHNIIGLPKEVGGLEKIFGFGIETIESQVGMPICDFEVVHVALFFANPELYREYSSINYEIIKDKFKYVS